MYRKLTVRDEKRALRHKYAAIRQSIPDRLEKSKAICDNFLGTMSYAHADTVLLYHSINQEVDTIGLIATLIASDKRVALPVCRENGEMIFRYLTDMAQLTKGFFSAPEPNSSCEEFISSRHAICVIPAIAFDKKGYRLGYGKGYYDRFLTDPSIVKVGFAYDELFVDTLPKGRFDIACDLVITPKGVFNTGEK